MKDMKLLEENIKETLQDIGIVKEFLDKTPKAQAINTKQNNKYDYVDPRSSYRAEQSNQQRTFNQKNGKNYLQAIHLTKDSYPGYR